MKRGAFIVIEGCDRAGKSTQCQKLVEYFTSKGKDVQKLNFPDRATATGKLISQYLEGKTKLNNQAIHLLFSANRWEAEPNILKTLRSGSAIICDRYAYSGVAYSSAKKDIDLNWCKQADVGLPKPDLVLFLDLAPDILESREGFGNEFYEKIQFQTLVREQFFKLKEDNWRFVDASKSLENVTQEIVKCLDNLNLELDNEVESLWVT